MDLECPGIIICFSENIDAICYLLPVSKMPYQKSHKERTKKEKHSPPAISPSCTSSLRKDSYTRFGDTLGVNYLPVSIYLAGEYSGM